MKLKDCVALVTGGSTGIGRAAAVAMAQEGARVAITARRAERCQEAIEEIESIGGEAIAIPGDVSQAEHVEQLVAQTVDHWGRLDIVVANAGINGVFAPIEELTPEEWDQTQSINLRGTFLSVKYAIPHLKQRGGSIIVVSSVNGTRMFSSFGYSCYATSKAGQVAFTKMAALELAQFGIRVNVVCPGATKTNIGENTHFRDVDKITIPRQFPQGAIPLGARPAAAEEVGSVILHLASDESSYVTGTEVYVDGALSLFQG